MGGISRREQETTIRWDAEERIASIFTCDPVTIRKLDRLVQEHPDTYKLVRTGKEDYPTNWYEVEASHIRFMKPASEARREAARQAAAARGFGAK